MEVEAVSHPNIPQLLSFIIHAPHPYQNIKYF